MRGCRRRVVEVLARERVQTPGLPGHGYYVLTVRLACGHAIRQSAKNRYRKGDTPVVGYCKHPECIMALGVEP